MNTKKNVLTNAIYGEVPRVACAGARSGQPLAVAYHRNHYRNKDPTTAPSNLTKSISFPLTTQEPYPPLKTRANQGDRDREKEKHTKEWDLSW